MQLAAGENGEVEVERGFFEVDFEAVGEGAALLVDDAAGGGDDERRIGELELADAVFDDVATHSALAGDGRGHAEEQADEMRVVNVQIDERSADFFRIPKVFEPQRIGNHAFEVAAEQLAIFAAVDQLAGVGIFGQKRQAVADENLLFALCRPLS